MHRQRERRECQKAQVLVRETGGGRTRRIRARRHCGRLTHRRRHERNDVAQVGGRKRARARIGANLRETGQRNHLTALYVRGACHLGYSLLNPRDCYNITPVSHYCERHQFTARRSSARAVPPLL